MADRIAIKRLSSSDCTLFEAVFRKINAGNQKSINLNADILTGKFYPNLGTGAASTENAIALPLTIYGPGAAGAYKITRKIIKNATYKNWRLNGEFVHGPPEDPSRYDDIAKDDLAVMIFEGDAAPTGMILILVSKSAPADSALHVALDGLFSNSTMIEVAALEIYARAKAALTPEQHPIFLASVDLEFASMLEDAAQGGLEGASKLLKNRSGRRTSVAELASAKAKAQLTGQNGEGLVNAYLAGQLAAGALTGYTWVSAENAVAPFDFEIVAANGQRTLIDAKSTSGPFENPLHISLAEIIEASGDAPYLIYRVFDLDDDGGGLCVSEDIRPLARQLKSLHEAYMPAGVRVDGFSVATSVLAWGAVEVVTRPDEDGGD